MIIGIVTFAFGEPADSRANGKLAAITTSKAVELEAHVFTQNDVCPAGLVVTRATQRGDEGPPPTLRIAREAMQWVEERGIQNILVVAAKPHLRRCLRDLRKAAREAGVTLTIRSVEGLEKHRWYDPTSTQKRVRSRLNWWPRELILRAMPFSLYKGVAG